MSEKARISVSGDNGKVGARSAQDVTVGVWDADDQAFEVHAPQAIGRLCGIFGMFEQLGSSSTTAPPGLCHRIRSLGADLQPSRDESQERSAALRDQRAMAPARALRVALNSVVGFTNKSLRAFVINRFGLFNQLGEVVEAGLDPEVAGLFTTVSIRSPRPSFKYCLIGECL